LWLLSNHGHAPVRSCRRPGLPKTVGRELNRVSDMRPTRLYRG
jgi:hypothetical protein